MIIRNIALAAAALSLAASPAIAEAAFDRSSAPLEGESEAAGGAGVLLGILAAAAVVGGIIVAASDNDAPASP
ncbi:MAG: hypothetical protein ACX930_06145 [Erythrobacter sp.]